jgi:hypothetical protein
VGFLNDLVESVGRTCAGLADKRRGKNSQFSMRDIGLAGFAPFFMQSPSFLSHQRQICEGIGHGRSNCQTLLGMGDIPTDNHIRTMLDDVEPSSLFGLFDEVVAAAKAAGALPSLTSLGGHTLIAMDGTQYFCSNKLSCKNCSTRKHANGQIDYFHTVMAASIVKPGKNWVLPLRPEFVEPQQGGLRGGSGRRRSPDYEQDRPEFSRGTATRLPARFARGRRGFEPLSFSYCLDGLLGKLTPCFEQRISISVFPH